jgi:bifunctional non-homologous end joining protein LigD
MNDFLASLSDEERAQLRQSNHPEWREPMLATLTDERFSDDNWIFERKLDGERCMTIRDGDEVRLMSRNRKELNGQYPELVAVIGRQKESRFILDGEIVAFEGNLTSFSRLQQRMHLTDPEEVRQSQVAVYYYLFDLLYLAGYDLTGLPLRRRKVLLKKALSFEDPLRFLNHRNADGEAYFNEACRKRWEGIIAKQAEADYVHARSRKWLKFKCVNQQELVIGGFTEPQGERIGFGALLVGYYAGDTLKYAGKVGTGYDDETLHRLKQQLTELERETPPFVDDDVPDQEVHWTRPELVAEIGFEEWTDYGKLRQPRFLGLRRDKSPGQVVKEEASV